MNVNVPPHGLRTANETPRVDLLLIAEMVTPGARVLDIGCGDGTLMRLLASKRGADARGIELSQAGVNSCVAQGLAVIGFAVLQSIGLRRAGSVNDRGTQPRSRSLA